MKELYNDSELLAIDMRRPSALAAHYEIIVVAILLDPAFEGDGRALNRPFFASLRPWSEIAIVARRKFRERTVVLFTLAIMIEDQVRLTPANQPKTHADASIVSARMTHRRIER
jgi:hypothetical protein